MACRASPVKLMYGLRREATGSSLIVTKVILADSLGADNGALDKFVSCSLEENLGQRRAAKASHGRGGRRKDMARPSLTSHRACSRLRCRRGGVLPVKLGNQAAVRDATRPIDRATASIERRPIRYRAVSPRAAVAPPGLPGAAGRPAGAGRSTSPSRPPIPCRSVGRSPRRARWSPAPPPAPRRNPRRTPTWPWRDPPRWRSRVPTPAGSAASPSPRHRHRGAAAVVPPRQPPGDPPAARSPSGPRARRAGRPRRSTAAAPGAWRSRRGRGPSPDSATAPPRYRRRYPAPPRRPPPAMVAGSSARSLAVPPLGHSNHDGWLTEAYDARGTAAGGRTGAVTATR